MKFRVNLAILWIISCLFTLVACNSADNGASRKVGEDNMNPYFTGKVTEIYDEGCLLEVTDVGNGNFWVGSKVKVNTDIKDCPDYEVGDLLKITFDGKVTRSLPPQVTCVFSVDKSE